MNNSPNKQVILRKKQQVQELLHQKKLTEAHALCAELCRLDEADADNYCALGVVEAHLGRFGAAQQCFEHAIALAPNLPFPHYYRGGALISQKKLAEAAEPLRNAVRLKPDFAEAHLSLGDVLYALADYSGARAAYERAVQLRPDLGEAHYGLGRTLHTLGEPHSAIDALRTAVRLRPDHASAHRELGSVVLTQGLFEEAEQYFTRALELCRKHNLGAADELAAVAGLASVRERRGDIEGAFRIIEPHIARGDKHGALALVFTKLCRRLKRCEEALAYAESSIEEGNLSDVEIAHVHFALGQLCDALGDFDRAFSHMNEANRRMNRIHGEDNDRPAFGQYVADSEQVFSGEAFATLPRARIVSDLPVFIVGMPRSGTSLVEQILASHPNVHGGGELPTFKRIVNALSGAGRSPSYPHCVPQLAPEVMDTLASGYLDALKAIAPKALRVTDKLPHNFLHLGLIALLFPAARIIHCRRDPLDTCLSIFFQDFGARHTYAYDLAHLGHHYRCYERLMQHWRTVLPIPMLEIQYEELVNDFENHARRLVDFINLPWDARCLEFHRSKRIVATASYDQVRRPIYTGSIGRWRHYSAHLGPLRAALGIDAAVLAVLSPNGSGSTRTGTMA